MTRRSVVRVLLGAALLLGAAPASAQAPTFGRELLPRLRRVAELMPGERPMAVRVVSLLPGRGPRRAMVEGAPAADTITIGYPVYQLRFRTGWIMVDAGVDSLFVRPGLTFSRQDYDAVQQGLRGAHLVLLTHEHPDHVAALFRSPSLSEVQRHTLLTRAQVRSLVEHPLDRELGLDSATAAKYVVVDYQGWMPVAPGVVLLQAPGHSPGTQLVYVHLASGTEILIAGDVAWHTSGITEGRQKPERPSRSIGEDREAIAPQLAWLKDVAEAGVAVVVYHDQAAHDSLIARGILKKGFDLGRMTAGQEPSGPAAALGAKPYFVYVGTSTGDPAGGIHVLRFDPADGSLTRAPVAVARSLNPSFLALSPDGRMVYAVSEVEAGAVAAFRRDSTGALTELGRRSSGGAGPAYVAVGASGRWLTVANYGGGSVALLPIDADGALGDPVDVAQHKGSGPNPDRQKGPHAHFARPSPDGRWVFVTDLGIDQVIAYPVGGDPVRLNAARAVVTRTAPGAGPRHLAFHPHRPFVYLVSELAGTVTAYRYDAGRGRLSEIQTLSALPDGFHGANGSADIHVHPNGRWLYASNRGDFDSIALFSIDAKTGRLTPLGHEREGIVWPRNFVIDPTGRWLLVGNQRADEVRVYAIDPGTGRLRPAPSRVSVPGPTNVLLAPGP